jgi:hypothetical protein
MKIEKEKAVSVRPASFQYTAVLTIHRKDKKGIRNFI